jgi:MFS family permease
MQTGPEEESGPVEDLSEDLSGGLAGKHTGFGSLPKGAQRYLIATLVNMVGNGMMFAFVFIYLHDVRGYSGSLTGWILATGTVTTLLTTTFGGWVSDHLGPKRALIIANLISAVAFGAYGTNHTVVLAFVMSIFTGVCTGMAFPAQQAFASVIVTPLARPTMSSWLRVLLNIGAGIGGALGGFIANVHRPSTFTLLFVGNAATYIGYIAIVASIEPVLTPAHAELEGKQAGYREVLRDRFFVRLLPLDLATGLAFGLAFLVMPGTYVKRLGASEHVVGLLFLLGASVVVVSQIPISKAVSGRRRMSSLAAMFALFGVVFSFGIVSAGQTLTVAVICVALAQIMGGLAECFLGPVRNPLTAELAPPRLLGRYFGLASMLFQGGFGFANVLGGIGLDRSVTGLWIVGAAIMACAFVWSIRLDRLIPSTSRISP